MKKLPITFFKKSFLLLSLLLLSSCALKPISSEIEFMDTDTTEVSLDNLGDGKVLIYNGANLLHKMDNTARLNVWINEKPLGQIRGGEYAIVQLSAGKHQIKLLHIDMVKMTSYHEIEVDKNSRVIKIKPTITSNNLEVTNVLPSDIDKFTYAQKR